LRADLPHVVLGCPEIVHSFASSAGIDRGREAPAVWKTLPLLPDGEGAKGVPDVRVIRSSPRFSREAQYNGVVQATQGNDKLVMRFRIRHLLIAMVVVAFGVCGIHASRNVYELYGDLETALIPALGGFLLLGTAPVLFFPRARKWWCASWIVALSCFIWRQEQLSRRLAVLRSDVDDVISYAESYRKDHGEYPLDLSGLKLKHPDLAEFIDYRTTSAYVKTFEVRWHPLRIEGIAHWYAPEYGHYFEDD
jgi:hypothetical protein